MSSIYDFSALSELALEAEGKILPYFSQIEQTAFENQLRVQTAFYDNRISTAHFMPTFGYGYDDEGREALDSVYASVFGCEAAVVRSSIASGTHALSTMLFAVLRPGDKLLSVTGTPYDTLRGVISGDSGSSLKDFKIDYDQVSLCNGLPDYAQIEKKLCDKSIRAVLVQRSRGYELRPSLSISDIKDVCTHIKKARPDVLILVDNCYGEFTETAEPTSVGADLMAGSLIKNPGGGLAPCGGYIAGKADLVRLAADRLTAPGVGLETGANLGLIKSLFQGFYMSPHTVAQAMKTALFCGALFEEMGFEIFPKLSDKRSDIIQAVSLGNAENVIKFCEGIQSGSPVDSFAAPVPWAMPGYDCEVIMAAGAFNQGSSIEISADAPIRPPYTVYMQGGLTYQSGKIAVLCAAKKIKNC